MRNIFFVGKRRLSIQGFFLPRKARQDPDPAAQQRGRQLRRMRGHGHQVRFSNICFRANRTSSCENPTAFLSGSALRSSSPPTTPTSSWRRWTTCSSRSEMGVKTEATYNGKNSDGTFYQDTSAKTTYVPCLCIQTSSKMETPPFKSPSLPPACHIINSL